MRLVQRTMVGAVLLITSMAASAIPVTVQFTATPGGFGWSGPSEEYPEFPLPVIPAALNALANQPITGSVTFETERPALPGYLPYEGQNVEIGASYLNPVLSFDLQLGPQTFSFVTASPPDGVRESSITVIDLPSQLTAFPGDWYDLYVTLGTGLIDGFESYRFSASLSMTEAARRIDGYDPVQPLLLTDAPWRFQFSLFDPANDASYSLYTSVTNLQIVEATQVPEPGTLGMFAIALLAVGLSRRRQLT
jgi:hypothetical protein